MVAARSSHDPGYPGLRFDEAIHVHETAADFECARGCVVLVLHPYVAPGSGAQFGPGILGRRRHHLVDEIGRTVEFLERHCHAVRLHLDSYPNTDSAIDGMPDTPIIAL